MKTHRVSWMLHHGDPGALHVLHRCDNPLCVNPAHLWLGTHAANMKDMMRKGRHRTHDQRGTANPRARLTESQVVELRRLYASGQLRQTQLASRFGITQAQVSAIVRRDAWAHL